MLITFSCEGYSNIVMFADVGLRILRLMGYADQRSGNISPEEAGQVLIRMKKGLAELKAKAPAAAGTNNKSDDFSDAPVGLDLRAMPLMELLEFAVKEEHPVSWKAS